MRFAHSSLARALLLSSIAAACLPPVAGGARAAAPRPQEPPPQSGAASDAATPADTAQAVELYQRGEHSQAVEILRGAVKRRKTDAQAWLHLGIALTRAGKVKDARKAFERAIRLRPATPQAHVGMAYSYAGEGKLREADAAARRAVELDPQSAEARYALAFVRMRQGSPEQALAETDAALRLNPNFGAALLLKKEAALEAYAADEAGRFEKYLKAGRPLPEFSPEELARRSGLLKEGAGSIEKYLRLYPAARDAARLREELESLRFHADRAGRGDEPLVYRPDAVTTRAQIVSKPEPLYTEEARQNLIRGTVRLRLVLSFDGRVRHILAVKSLKGGLTEMAVNAARRIKFVPATKDGRPVSQFVVIEYNFHIY